ncbi:hypothetical protein [Methanoculleus sp.]|uniref:hypothetical protein n=1 Tax=Methanoculleus sp. TaxID=90427 RepID=UPI001BD3AF18|nr:hypothetical protein [Methanoculleus sp.]
MMDPIPEEARSGLERLIKEDLRGATVSSCAAAVDEDGRIYFDEITLRRQDGREVVVATGTRSGYPVVVLEVNTGSGWRDMTVPEDYRDELEELTAEPWRPDPPAAWDHE